MTKTDDNTTSTTSVPSPNYASNRMVQSGMRSVAVHSKNYNFYRHSLDVVHGVIEIRVGYGSERDTQ